MKKICVILCASAILLVSDISAMRRRYDPTSTGTYEIRTPQEKELISNANDYEKRINNEFALGYLDPNTLDFGMNVKVGLLRKGYQKRLNDITAQENALKALLARKNL